ncbi:hypothetical protein Hanom_Chr01g00091951 [Helianthus anomalus]
MVQHSAAQKHPMYERRGLNCALCHTKQFGLRLRSPYHKDKQNSDIIISKQADKLTNNR